MLDQSVVGSGQCHGDKPTRQKDIGDGNVLRKNLSRVIYICIAAVNIAMGCGQCGQSIEIVCMLPAVLSAFVCSISHCEPQNIDTR